MPAPALRQASEEGRRARQLERAAELDAALVRLAGVARRPSTRTPSSTSTSTASATRRYLRAADAAEPRCARENVRRRSRADPFAFVLERRQAFYATDFKRLLWALPYYRGEVRDRLAAGGAGADGAT